MIEFGVELSIVNVVNAGDFAQPDEQIREVDMFSTAEGKL